MRTARPLQLVLWLIGIYHLGLGLLPFLPPAVATRIISAIFGMEFEVAPQLRYLGQLFGIYAFVFGLVALVVAADPLRHRALIPIVVALYCLRVLNRIIFVVQFMDSFQTTAFRAWLEVALLAIFGLAVLLLRPRGDLRREAGAIHS